MTNVFLNVIGGVISGLTLAALVGLWKMLRSFIHEQREANKRSADSIHSMQRAEITRMFQRVVEDGKPVSVEEMDHLNALYKAYSGDGCDGVGELMYKRIKDQVIIKTKTV